MSGVTPSQLAQEFSTSDREVRTTLAFLFGELPDGVDGWRLDDDQANYVRTYIYGMRSNAGHYGGPSASDAEQGFSRLVLKDWRQFTEVDIDLRAQLTIITGENGTGKTSLLQILGQAFDQQVQFVGTPTRDAMGFYFQHGRRRPQSSGELDQVGSITFASGGSSHVGVRLWDSSDQPSFTPELVPRRSVAGMYLDAQRLIGPYQRVESIPPRFNSASEIARIYKEQLRNLWIPHMNAKSPSLLMKEALIAAALYGEGSAVLTRDPKAHEVWEGFQDILAKLLPPSLGFTGLRVDQGEIVLQSESGPFALEAASGGVAAILSLAWQIYLSSVEIPGQFTVCFDEPENHLHPALQRSILPSLLEVFPDVKFIVATHSPFVVTSTQSASVYALRRRHRGRIYAERLDLRDQALTADEVLNDVLGVGTTIPIWAERRMQKILLEFSRKPFDPESVGRMVTDLESAGLRLTMPDVANALTASEEGRS